MSRVCTRFVLPLLLGLFSARAGTALIINIDATTNNFANPINLLLAAGTYTVTPIGIAGGGLYDAWNPWGDATCGNPSGCTQTLPTTVTGWKNSYDVLSEALSAVSVNGSPLSPIPSEPTDIGYEDGHWISNGTETDRYHADSPIVYPTAADAFPGAESSVFTVTSAGFVSFAIRDDVPVDNLGGMSLEILAIPEPSTGALLTVGVMALALRRRR